MSSIILIPIIISSVSLIASVLTFYLTQLKPSNISVLIGPDIAVYHAVNPELFTGVCVPMTFINTSPNMGTVFRCAVSIFRTDEPEQRFFMIWFDFLKTNADREWKHDGDAHSFAVSGKTSISKIAKFAWHEESNPKLCFKKGSYTLVVHLWIDKNRKPKNTTFNFHIAQSDDEVLQKRIDSKSTDTYWISLNKDFDRNKVLTIHEYKVLLE